MHNCTQTKEQITEFVLDGAERPDERLSRELRHCAECRAEFESLDATLRITRRLREAVAPAESYWPGYHTRLRQKLVSSVEAETRRPSWFARFLKSSVPVPVPVAAVLILLCAVLFTLAIKTPEPTNRAHIHQLFMFKRKCRSSRRKSLRELFIANDDRRSELRSGS